MKSTSSLLIATSVLLHASAFAKVIHPVVRCSTELDRTVLFADQQQKAVIKITLDALAAPVDTERPPVNLCIVMDRSGSMNGSKIQRAREAAKEAVNRLGHQDVFSLVTYNSGIDTLIPARRVQNLHSLHDTISRISAKGNTALFGGVSQGASELRKNLEDSQTQFVHRMILLSDGRANVGPSTPAELGRLGASLMKENISVTTVGVGNDYNEDLMTRLSSRSDGNTYFVEASQDLPGIFQEELGDVLSVVARKIIVTVECPAGVRPLRTIGREARIRGQQVEIRLNQLYGGQEKYLLLEVEVEPTPEKESRQLAVASLSYEDAISARREKVNSEVFARFSREEENVTKSVNPTVVNEYFINVGAESKDEAVRLYEAGQRDDAIQVLERNSEILKQASADYDLEELELEGQNLLDQSQRLSSQGLTQRNRKELKTEAYQERAQQKSKLRYKKY